MMDADEREIFQYLRSEREVFVPAHSINRHAGGKRKFRETPDWARSALLRMQERGILEMDVAGSFRLKPVPRSDSKTKHWVSPQIRDMLRRSGKNFDRIFAFEGDDEAYYDSL